jgi:hypothetical protein
MNKVKIVLVISFFLHGIKVGSYLPVSYFIFYLDGFLWFGGYEKFYCSFIIKSS